MTRCGLMPSEIKTCSQFSRKLKGYEEFLQKNAVSYDVIRGLITTNSTVREIALAQIASGVRFDTSDLRAVRRGVADSKLTEFQYQARASKKAMLDAARRRSAETVQEFQCDAVALLEKVAALPTATTRSSTSRQMAEIAQDAARPLPVFEMIAGSDHPREGEQRRRHR